MAVVVMFLLIYDDHVELLLPASHSASVLILTLYVLSRLLSGLLMHTLDCMIADC